MTTDPTTAAARTDALELAYAVDHLAHLMVAFQDELGNLMVGEGSDAEAVARLYALASLGERACRDILGGEARRLCEAAGHGVAAPMRLDRRAAA